MGIEPTTYRAYRYLLFKYKRCVLSDVDGASGAGELRAGGDRRGGAHQRRRVDGAPLPPRPHRRPPRAHPPGLPPVSESREFPKICVCTRYIRKLNVISRFYLAKGTV